MNNTDSNSEQNNQTSIPVSLRLALFAATLTTIADGIAVLSALAAIDEAQIANEKEKQDNTDLEEKLNNIQLQIDQLTIGLSKARDSNV